MNGSLPVGSCLLNNRWQNVGHFKGFSLGGQNKHLSLGCVEGDLFCANGECRLHKVGLGRRGVHGKLVFVQSVHILVVQALDIAPKAEGIGNIHVSRGLECLLDHCVLVNKLTAERAVVVTFLDKVGVAVHVVLMLGIASQGGYGVSGAHSLQADGAVIDILGRANHRVDSFAESCLSSLKHRLVSRWLVYRCALANGRLTGKLELPVEGQFLAADGSAIKVIVLLGLVLDEVKAKNAVLEFKSLVYFGSLVTAAGQYRVNDKDRQARHDKDRVLQDVHDQVHIEAGSFSLNKTHLEVLFPISFLCIYHQDGSDK